MDNLRIGNDTSKPLHDRTLDWLPWLLPPSTPLTRQLVYQIQQSTLEHEFYSTKLVTPTGFSAC